MSRPTSSPSTQHVYRSHGVHTVRAPICEPVEPEPTRIPTIADTVPASWIMSRDIVCAREDLEVDALMELMVRHHIGCVPVVDERGWPIGMVTKLDVVEQVVAARDPEAAPPVLVASQLMMPIALTLDERATVAHAAAMMSMEDVHHVAIVADSGCPIGVVSTMDVVRWLAANDGLFARS